MDEYDKGYKIVSRTIIFLAVLGACIKAYGQVPPPPKSELVTQRDFLLKIINSTNKQQSKSLNAKISAMNRRVNAIESAVLKEKLKRRAEGSAPTDGETPSNGYGLPATLVLAAAVAAAANASKNAKEKAQ